MGLEIARKGDREARGQVDEVDPVRLGEVEQGQLAIANVGHEHQPQTANERDERTGRDPGRAAERDRRDREEQDEVPDRVREEQGSADRVRFCRGQCR